MDYTKLTDKDLYTLSQKYGAAALKYKRKFAGTLPEINRRSLYFSYGMHSIYEFGSRVGGLSHDTVNRILKIGEKLRDKPSLNEKFTDGEVGWAKLEIVSRVATKSDEQMWAKRVESMSYGALQTMVKADCGASVIDARELYENFNIKLKRKTLSQFRVFKKRLEKSKKQPLTWDDTVHEIIETNQIKPPKPGRNIPAAQQRELEQKYKGICAFPGCNKPADVVHHPERYALTRSHKNLQPLCKAHHEIAHQGLIHNEEKDPSTWKILNTPEYSHLKRKIDQKYLSHSAPRSSYL